MVGLSSMGDKVKAKYGCEWQSKFRYRVTDRFWFFLCFHNISYSTVCLLFASVCKANLEYR